MEGRGREVRGVSYLPRPALMLLSDLLKRLPSKVPTGIRRGQKESEGGRRKQQKGAEGIRRGQKETAEWGRLSQKEAEGIRGLAAAALEMHIEGGGR